MIFKIMLFSRYDWNEHSNRGAFQQHCRHSCVRQHDVNKEYATDKARFSYDGLSKKRLTEPMVRDPRVIWFHMDGMKSSK